MVARLLVVFALAVALQAQTAPAAKAPEDVRQQKLREAAAQLAKLSNELKKTVDATRTDELNVQVVREAEKIERLAKDLKEHPPQ